MRKLFKLIILTVAITGSYTGILSIVNKINAAQKGVNLQTKYLANNQENRQIKFDNKKNINSQLSTSEKLSNFRLIKFDDTTFKSLNIDEKKLSKLSTLSRQNILKEAPIGPSQPPTRPVIDVHLNKSVEDKEINKPSANNIPEDPQFKPVMEYAIKQNLSQRPMPEIMQAIADYFIGTPYKAGL
ncbi:MAG: hypothetical protein F6K17_16735, partial [Okeania sp. SIO3C4]|nr:hypothetical protein [Okeania sp. SIO3C4]